MTQDHPQEYAMRALWRTERHLQRIISSKGLTLWGEAANLILEECAARPDLAAQIVPPRDDLPPHIFRQAPPNQHNSEMSVAKGIWMRPSLSAWRFITEFAATSDMTVNAATSAVVHCLAPIFAAQIDTPTSTQTNEGGL